MNQLIVINKCIDNHLIKLKHFLNFHSISGGTLPLIYRVLVRAIVHAFEYCYIM